MRNCTSSFADRHTAPFKSLHEVPHTRWEATRIRGGLLGLRSTRWSTSIVVNEPFVLRVPSKLNLAGGAPLLCAGITTYSPMRCSGVGKLRGARQLGVGRWVAAIGRAACEALAEAIDSGERAIDAIARARLAVKTLSGETIDWRAAAGPAVAAVGAFMGQRSPGEVAAALKPLTDLMRSAVRSAMARLDTADPVAVKATLAAAARAVLNADGEYGEGLSAILSGYFSRRDRYFRARINHHQTCGRADNWAEHTESDNIYYVKLSHSRPPLRWDTPGPPLGATGVASW